jgi:hypothetical protein
MTLDLSKPAAGDVGWSDEVNQNFTDVETGVNALEGRSISTTSPLTGGGTLAGDLTLGLGTVPESKGGTNQTAYATGDLLYASAADTLAKLAGNTSSTKKVLTQTGTGSVSGAPTWDTLSALIDSAIGSTQGTILYRGASAWAALAAGTAGHVLTSQGAGANPTWSAPTGGAASVVGSALNTTAGVDASVTVPAGTLDTSGQYLLILGSVANAGGTGTMSLKLGGTTLLTVSGVSAAGFVLAYVRYTGSSSWEAGGLFTYGGGPSNDCQQVTGTTSWASSQNVVLHTTDSTNQWAHHLLVLALKP